MWEVKIVHTSLREIKETRVRLSCFGTANPQRPERRGKEVDVSGQTQANHGPDNTVLQLGFPRWSVRSRVEPRKPHKHSSHDTENE